MADRFCLVGLQQTVCIYCGCRWFIFSPVAPEIRGVDVCLTSAILQRICVLAGALVTIQIPFKNYDLQLIFRRVKKWHEAIRKGLQNLLVEQK